MLIKRNTWSFDETAALACELARTLPKHTVLLLTGDVGTGKTAFVKGFMTEWALNAQVTSPTFTIMNEYRNNEVKVLHFDLYRLRTLEEVEDIGLEDFVSGADFTFIEWPELALPLFNFPVIQVHIESGSEENERIITIQGEAL